MIENHIINFPNSSSCDCCTSKAFAVKVRIGKMIFQLCLNCKRQYFPKTEPEGFYQGFYTENKTGLKSCRDGGAKN